MNEHGRYEYLTKQLNIVKKSYRVFCRCLAAWQDTGNEKGYPTFSKGISDAGCRMYRVNGVLYNAEYDPKNDT